LEPHVDLDLVGAAVTDEVDAMLTALWD